MIASCCRVLGRSTLPLGFPRSLLNFVGLYAIPLPYEFTINSAGLPLGTFRRLPQLRHCYLLDLSGGSGKRLDRRLAFSFAIVMAEFEDR